MPARSKIAPSLPASLWSPALPQGVRTLPDPARGPSGRRFARNRPTPLRLSSSRPVSAPESPEIRSVRDPILIDLLKLNGASTIFTPDVMAGRCSRFF